MKQILKYLPIALVTLGGLFILYSILTIKKQSIVPPAPKPTIIIKSIDTMKYSRDIAREKMNNPEFDQVIDQQVREIAQTGATHVAIGTPYDNEFVPFLKRWVDSARKNSLKVWFRGNLSGWEKWFDYPEIDRKTHLESIQKFILENADIFDDGDVFTPCSECENGGTGDPRKTGDVTGFRTFLIDEYNTSSNAFVKIKKSVKVGYFSMNYDVAKLIMDQGTTRALGGIVAIDHYVSSPEQIAVDAKKIAESSGGKVVLGEFGAPIPDLSGQMTEAEQAEWINKALNGFKKVPEVIGVNYWVNVGGSTQIWDQDGNPKQAVQIIKKFYSY